MRRTRLLVSLPLATGMLASMQGVTQTYPEKPVRIVTAEPGGSSDFAARLIAQGLTGSFGQQVIVDNRGGGSGVIAIETAAKSPADGYTMLLYSSGMWVLPLIQKVPYDPLNDFLPVTIAARAPNVLVVHPSLPVKSVKELIALARARPGELNYASGGTGTSTHLAPELLKYMAGVEIVRIIYKGGGPALNDVLGGQVQLLFGTAASVTPHVKTGRLRALAVTSAQPSALAPGLPTVAQSLPGYESVSMTGMFVPAGTAVSLVTRLNQETVRVLNRPDVKERFLNVGVEVVGSSPEQHAAIMKSEMVRLGKMIKEAGIHAD